MLLCLPMDYTFNDNILEANKYGVSHIVNPGGVFLIKMLWNVIKGYVMFHTGKRLFFH